VTGATGVGGILGAAEFIRTIEAPNNSVPPGTALQSIHKFLIVSLLLLLLERVLVVRFLPLIRRYLCV